MKFPSGELKTDGDLLPSPALRRGHQRLQHGPGLSRGLRHPLHRLRQVPHGTLLSERYHRLPPLPGHRVRRRIRGEGDRLRPRAPGQDGAVYRLRGLLRQAGRPPQGGVPPKRDGPLHRHRPHGRAHPQGAILHPLRPVRHRPPRHLRLPQGDGPRFRAALPASLHLQAGQRRGLLGAPLRGQREGLLPARPGGPGAHPGQGVRRRVPRYHDFAGVHPRGRQLHAGAHLLLRRAGPGEAHVPGPCAAGGAHPPRHRQPRRHPHRAQRGAVPQVQGLFRGRGLHRLFQLRHQVRPAGRQVQGL